MIKGMQPKKGAQGRPKDGARPPHPTMAILQTMANRGVVVYVDLVYFSGEWFVWVQAPADGYPEKVPVLTLHRNAFLSGEDLGRLISKIQKNLPNAGLNIVAGRHVWTESKLERRIEIICDAVEKAKPEAILFAAQCLDLKVNDDIKTNIINTLVYCSADLRKEACQLVAASFNLPKGIIQ